MRPPQPMDICAHPFVLSGLLLGKYPCWLPGFSLGLPVRVLGQNPATVPLVPVQLRLNDRLLGLGNLRILAWTPAQTRAESQWHVTLHRKPRRNGLDHILRNWGAVGLVTAFRVFQI